MAPDGRNAEWSRLSQAGAIRNLDFSGEELARIEKVLA